MTDWQWLDLLASAILGWYGAGAIVKVKARRRARREHLALCDAETAGVVKRLHARKEHARNGR